MTSGFAVPVVDIGPYVGDGGGVASPCIDALVGAMDGFFDQDLEVKQRWVAAGIRGYSPPRSESLSKSLGLDPYGGANDFFEAYNIGVEARFWPDLELSEATYGLNVWPDTDRFEQTVSAYFAEAGRVSSTLATIFADALDIEPGFFDAITDHSIDVLRMNNYAHGDAQAVRADELMGMGAHTDFGLVTVLWADQAPGLQVLGSDRRWHDVRPAEGALLVNLGDLTARLTNDRWLSTMHRVKPPTVDGTVARRRSAAFFRDGNADAAISPLPHCVEAGAGPRYEGSITVADHIAAKLGGSRAGRLNTRAGRGGPGPSGALTPLTRFWTVNKEDNPRSDVTIPQATRTTPPAASAAIEFPAQESDHMPDTRLAGIDADGLRALADGARSDPSVGRKTLKARTVCDGGFRNLTCGVGADRGG